jgi:virginiamycin B lyase
MRMAELAVLTAAIVQATGSLNATAQVLPAGAGLEEVEAVCSGCHSTELIRRSSGYMRDEWDALTAAMVDLSGDPQTRATILDYLATSFPPRQYRQSTQAPGDMTLRFEEWVVPTRGQRARDPVEAPDGSIWWVGQWTDILGRIDPATGAMTEFMLTTGARPHSVEIGTDGGVWYTGNKNATIGRLDSVTGEIVEYPMPDAAARDPHTHLFDARGILWFTLQQSNMIGRLDPVTGEIRLIAAPSPGSRPYGLKSASDGAVWVACNRSNCLLRIDAESLTVSEIKLPEMGTTVRRLDIDANGIIWWVNSGLGRLGSYDPRSGEIREWTSPSGPKSHPYAIAVFDGAVWFNESGVRPDMLVRFDPATEAFQSWPIPSGDLYAGILRHMRVSRDGKALLIHQTATNRIARVSIEKRSGK